MEGEIIVLAQMETKPRRVIQSSGAIETMETAAFMGATDTFFPEFGIGLSGREGLQHVCTAISPCALMDAWRGMQILDQLSDIGWSTVFYVSLVGIRNRIGIESALEELKEQLPEIERLREELLRKPISDQELERIMDICEDPRNRLTLVSQELQSEIEAGTIRVTERVRRAFGLDRDDK